jgi:hypothetical protein
MPGPIGAGNPIIGSHPNSAPKVISIPITSELNKLPQPSSIAVSYSQSQNVVQQQQVVPSQSVESLSSSGRPDGSAAVGSKTSGFMSKIFGKPKDTQEEFQRRLTVHISLNVCLPCFVIKEQLLKQIVNGSKVGV